MTNLKIGFNARLGEVRRHTVRGLCNTALRACGVLLAILSQPALAANCSFTSVTAISFGSYNVFAASPNDSGVGTIQINCIGGEANMLVTLSTGQSGNYAARLMNSGADLLTYNLYTNAARNVIWGDGTGGSSTMAADRNSTTTLSIFGRIPGGQDAAVGTYSDFIIATVNF
ncbi:MAG: spore coat U domain-containing protein [Burkholderiales bacterium]|nr:spore coat U domain-containing protein [Burkholderiales bacterium]